MKIFFLFALYCLASCDQSAPRRSTDVGSEPEPTQPSRLAGTAKIVAPKKEATIARTEPLGLRRPSHSTSSQKLNPIYIGNVGGVVNDRGEVQVSAELLGKLQDLHRVGVNSVVTGGWSGDAKLKLLLEAFRHHPILSLFKVILGAHGDVFDAYAQGQSGSGENLSCPERDFAVSEALLRKLTTFAKWGAQEFSDVVAGYYTFDEPAWYGSQGKPCAVRKEYQEQVYQILRGLDPDSVKRPILLSQTWAGYQNPKNRPEPKDYFTQDAYDILMYDHYTRDIEEQKQALQSFKSLELLTKQLIVVLPSYAYESCPASSTVTSVQQLFDSQVAILGRLGSLESLVGVSHFAFWITKPEGLDYAVDMANCEVLYQEAYRQLLLWKRSTSGKL